MAVKFWLFLLNLKNSSQLPPPPNAVLILDNTVIHCTNNVKAIFNNQSSSSHPTPLS